MEWIYKDTDVDFKNKLKSIFKIDDITARLIINRGIKSIDEADYLLNRDYKLLENPFLFKDMFKAVSRIKKAVHNNENVLISGDRDTDGLTSISILYKVLTSLNLNVIYSFPGEDQDYGFVPEIFDICEKNNISLVITVDSGISEVQNIKTLRDMNIDVILTDHHLPDDENLPLVDYLLNPNVDKNYPCPHLSGGAVAFKLAQAIVLSKNHNYNKQFLFVSLLFENQDSDNLKNVLDSSKKIIGVSYVLIKNFQLITKNVLFQNNDESQNKTINEKCFEIQSQSKFIAEFETLLQNVESVYFQNCDNNIESVKKLLFENLNLIFDDYKNNISFIVDTDFLKVSDYTNNTIENLANSFLNKIFSVDVEFNIFNKKFITITAVSVIGDVMSLIGENRLIVKYALAEMNHNIFTGLKHLFNKTSVLPGSATAKDIAFKVVPVLNAARRMGLTDLALKTILSQNESESEKLTDELLLLNQSRKTKFNDYKELVYEELYKQVDINKESVLVVATDKIDHGVTGLIASRIKEDFNRPVIILIIKDDVAQGTARSVDNFHIVHAMDSCSELLEKYGGHRVAAGLSMKTENIDIFRKKINEYAYTFFKDIVFSDSIEIDAVLNIQDINYDLYNNIMRLEPFGKGFPEPVFVIKDVKKISKRQIGVDKSHLRIGIYNGKEWINGIGFSLGKYALQNKPMSIAFSLEENIFNGKKSLQLNVKDIKV